MTEDLQHQLTLLRRKIRQIEQKWRQPQPAPPAQTLAEEDYAPLHHFIDEFMSGTVVETSFGKHFETEKLIARHKRHGSMDISFLSELPDDLLGPLSEGTAPPCSPTRWAFLDTETTGLAMGSGTYAFLVGVGRITPEGFRIRQFFMRDFAEESSLLERLAEHLGQFDVLVTYNGKTYDQPLLETRYRMLRRRPPFERLAHVDLLAGARRLWRLRLESCRLIDLENQILGVEREGDLPGEMIPYVYFEYLRRRQAVRLVPIFHHNAVDILTLACLAGIIPFAFRSPQQALLHHGADWLGLARWLLKADRYEEALELMRRAVEHGLPDSLLFRSLWDMASLEKRLGRTEAALAAFEELADSLNPFQTAALVELAKYYEHRRRDFSKALEYAERALTLEDSPDLRHRAARLRRRISKFTTGRLI